MLGKTRIVKQQHAIPYPHPIAQGLYPLAVERRYIPLNPGQQLLDTLGIRPGKSRGDRIAILAGQIRQLPGAIPFQILTAFRALEVMSKGRQERGQVRQRLYSRFDNHEYPPAFQKDTHPFGQSTE